MGGLDDIETAVQSLKKKQKKLKYIFMIILGLAESFKQLASPTVTLFDNLLLEKYER